MKASLRRKIIAYLIWKRKKIRKRSMYIRPIFEKRLSLGEHTLISDLAYDPHYHFRYFRMEKFNFDVLLEGILPNLLNSQNHRCPISPTEKLAITLRYLATGNSQISLALNYRLSPTTVSVTVRKVMMAICEKFQDQYLPKPTSFEWKSIADEFEEPWNFPHCCGALDGKHVRIKAPPNSGSDFFNYKEYFSLVLLGCVDAKYKFTLVHIGAMGSASDGGIFQDSSFGKKLENGTLGLPVPSEISSGIIAPYIFIGDDAFPLKKYLLKPYPGNFLGKEEKVYNYRICRARRIVENGFGILAARWRILHAKIEANLQLAKLIVRTSVILHNFLIANNDFNGLTVDQEDSEGLIPGSWRNVAQNSVSIPLRRQGSNNYTVEASNIRDMFKNYFNSAVGSVPWQDDYVSRI